MKAHENWIPLIKQEINKEYYLNLIKFLKEDLKKYDILPDSDNWFSSLSIDPLKIKVIILGQDPYYNYSQAHGFSFSVPNGIMPPPSLLNIYKEIENEFKIKMSRKNGNLMPWVNQGVLLLNSILTVRKNQPLSHANIGWETFTDKIIYEISQQKNPKAFLLWGKYAKSKIKLINPNNNLILTSTHPSPRSADYGFFGNNHFILTNKFLQNNEIEPIDWTINDY